MWPRTASRRQTAIIVGLFAAAACVTLSIHGGRKSAIYPSVPAAKAASGPQLSSFATNTDALEHTSKADAITLAALTKADTVVAGEIWPADNCFQAYANLQFVKGATDEISYMESLSSDSSTGGGGALDWRLASCSELGFHVEAGPQPLSPRAFKGMAFVLDPLQRFMTRQRYVADRERTMKRDAAVNKAMHRDAAAAAAAIATNVVALSATVKAASNDDQGVSFHFPSNLARADADQREQVAACACLPDVRLPAEERGCHVSSRSGKPICFLGVGQSVPCAGAKTSTVYAGFNVVPCSIWHAAGARGGNPQDSLQPLAAAGLEDGDLQLEASDFKAPPAAEAPVPLAALAAAGGAAPEQPAPAPPAPPHRQVAKAETRRSYCGAATRQRSQTDCEEAAECCDWAAEDPVYSIEGGTAAQYCARLSLPAHNEGALRVCTATPCCELVSRGGPDKGLPAANETLHVCQSRLLPGAACGGFCVAKSTDASSNVTHAENNSACSLGTVTVVPAPAPPGAGAPPPKLRPDAAYETACAAVGGAIDTAQTPAICCGAECGELSWGVDACHSRPILTLVPLKMRTAFAWPVGNAAASRLHPSRRQAAAAGSFARCGAAARRSAASNSTPRPRPRRRPATRSSRCAAPSCTIGQRR
jgi:hypothetical protein